MGESGGSVGVLTHQGTSEKSEPTMTVQTSILERLTFVTLK